MLPFLEACDPSMLIIRLLQAWPVLQVIAESIPSRFQYGVDTRLKQITETLSLWSLVENWIYFSLNLNKMWRAERILLSVLLNLNDRWESNSYRGGAQRAVAEAAASKIRHFDSWVGAMGGCSVSSSKYRTEASSILISGTFTGFIDHGIPLL